MQIAEGNEVTGYALRTSLVSHPTNGLRRSQMLVASIPSKLNSQSNNIVSTTITSMLCLCSMLCLDTLIEIKCQLKLTPLLFANRA